LCPVGEGLLRGGRSDLRTDLVGKILIDVSNATRDDGDGLPGDLCYPGSSLAEKLQTALPDTGLLGDLGWQPERFEDLGDITTARQERVQTKTRERARASSASVSRHRSERAAPLR
jgi:hypothetical protein